MRRAWWFVLLVMAMAGMQVSAEQLKGKPVRVLLATSGPIRDFQFCQSVFAQAEKANVVEVALFSNLALPEAGERTPLKSFPYLLCPADQAKEADKAYNLSHYDVLIAFDFDWTGVEPE